MNSPLDFEELVPIPVPRSRVNEVYRLLASPPAEASPAASAAPALAGLPDDGTTEHDSSTVQWTVEDFRALIADGKTGTFRCTKMLDVLARRPDEAVGLRELEQEAGLGHNEVRGAVSGMTHFCGLRWPDADSRRIAPWTKIGRRIDRDDQRGEFAYALTASRARNWLRARQGD